MGITRDWDQIMKILLDHVEERGFWLVGNMEPMESFRKERNKHRDIIERSL